MLRKGFTLIEMSIVILIIGLVAAGIVVGHSMIETAAMRVITTEITLYSTAVKEFADKYQALPGDMNNAETVWFSDSGCPTTATNTTPKTPTCNGNGDGMIGDWTNTGVLTSGSEREWFRAWQQLADAGLIDGRFTGVPGSAANADAVIGTNVPMSKNGKGGWTLLFMASDGTTDTTIFTSATSSHVLMYGGQTTGSFTDTPILGATRMKALDDKMDDGFPFSGKIRVKKSTATTCTVDATSTSDYLLTTSNGLSCQLLYLMGM